MSAVLHYWWRYENFTSLEIKLSFSANNKFNFILAFFSGMCCSEHCIFLFYGLYYLPLHCHVPLSKLNIKFVKTWTLFSSNMNTIIRMLTGKWFEPRSISFLSCVIVCVRVVFRKTVVGDWCFNYLSGSHLQSQVKSLMRWWSTIFLKTTVTQTITLDKQ